MTDRARTRLLVSTDAKNEADDQFAIVHALLSPTLDVRGILPTHFGTVGSLEASRQEVDLLLDLLDMQGEVAVANGAHQRLADEKQAVESAAAHKIIEESHHAGTLYVAALGPLTDVASALLLDPTLASRDVVVVWIGGPPYDDVEAVYWPEYNLSNDVAAANVVFSSGISVWQVPMDVYTLVGVGYEELEERVRPRGRTGNYLVQQLLEWNNKNMSRAVDFRSLGDSPAISLVLNPFGAVWRRRLAPRFAADGSVVEAVAKHTIRVCVRVDSRYLLEDFFAKLKRAP
ncbi:nucleoside hydrolase [Tessaracoccus oleiagri]|uniref:Inosine-uridine nucleoside N-ribohydrolase n=1 Tax=Tessaracoccus oleiagri TaxID=686624 RepID=A0A1G9HM95_9ACTN|nr:nucleoside hydrolase [Tessaracoccus oleiagri]SDL13906.1 Inosine-uridine nucleoside N-ribohydrolase [Tessaracoccus oleiagri]